MATVSSALRLKRDAKVSVWWDALFVALALGHGGALLTWPSIPLIAIGLWWNANTIAHNFIHRPLFRSRWQRTLFSCLLTLLLGIPQTIWRTRHLAHHAGARARIKPSPLLVGEIGLLIALWAALLTNAAAFALTVYLPGLVIGLGLCQLQGHYEHARGTTGNYGRIYNLLFFNDGYHGEHHAHPGAHWTELPQYVLNDAPASRWPAVLRWLEVVNLCTLERMVLHSPRLQHFVVSRHERAWRKILAQIPGHDRGERIGIIGGGLFPRTAMILARLRPEARLLLIDMSAENLATAREFLGDEAEMIEARFDPSAPCDFDLLVIPLAFVGERAPLYERPRASFTIIHDWIWNRRGQSIIVSWLLLKRLNLVRG
jgi:hypothetical protein